MILVAQAWKHRALILAFVVAGLLALTKRQHETIVRLGGVIAAKPHVDEAAKVKTKTETGRKIVTERYEVVENCVPVIIERVETIEPTKTEVESETSHVEKPICEPNYVPRWLVGAAADPFRAQDGQMVNLGVTVSGRLHLYGGRSFNVRGGETRHAAGFMVGF